MSTHPLAPREVLPELLDSLPSDDPAARRSRRDLRRINFLMGNERWIARTLRKYPHASHRITEIGAGDGHLTAALARLFPNAEISAYDLAPRPPQLPDHVLWHRGDLLESGIARPGGTLIANLFLHHFEGSALNRLAEICQPFDLLMFNEPDRSLLAHRLGFLLHPWINHVTRHDMHASIRAGFSQNEIPRLLNLGTEWNLFESTTLRGARRVVARRG